MKTGYSKICITPPLGAPIYGYFDLRYTKGVLDDVFVRAIAFDDGDKKAVVIALDICEMPQAIFDKLKDAVSAACDVPREAVFISCSHTHTAPQVGGNTAEFDAYFTSCVKDAACYAISDLEDSTAYFAETECSTISYNRRYRMKDGSVMTNPGINNENVDCVLGEASQKVKLLKFKRKNDEIALVNFGTHADTIGGDFISADYPGVLCATLERALPEVKCAFLLAPEGDVNHINPFPTESEMALSKIDFDNVPRGVKLAEHMGKTIAGAVISVYTIAEEIEMSKISFAEKAVNLPSNQENDRVSDAEYIDEMYSAGRGDELPFKGMELTTVVYEAKRILDLQNGPESYEFLLSALKLGDIVFAGIAGEPFVKIGMRIDENSPFKATFTCALANAEGGYIPTSNAYDEGGYEARSSYLKRGGDDIIVSGMTELLNNLK